MWLSFNQSDDLNLRMGCIKFYNSLGKRSKKYLYILRGMVKNLPLLQRAGNNGHPRVHAVMCGNTYSNICTIIHEHCRKIIHVMWLSFNQSDDLNLWMGCIKFYNSLGKRSKKYLYILRGMVKNLPLLQRAGNNGHPRVHAVMCGNTYSDICTIIHGDSCFNLVKSVNWYRLHMTVRRTTRAFHGTMATKGLFITCPSANIIGIKGKLILRVNNLGIYFWK